MHEIRQLNSTIERTSFKKREKLIYYRKLSSACLCYCWVGE